jgi:glycosyltransferase involved in cell wall biosynthesis
MRVVIAHDFYETFGGAERVTAEIAAEFPDAPVYAILGRRSVARRMGIEDRVHPLLPERAPLLEHYRWLAPSYPALVRAARLPEADVIIASSYAYAHAFRTANRAPMVCYSHGPFRHLWTNAYDDYLPGASAGRLAFKLYAAAARAADREATASVKALLTQSPFTAEQIARVYGREAQIVPPPIDCDTFHANGSQPKGYFLFVGRLVEAYKRPSIVVDAFRSMPDLKLLIAGDGPARADLEARAPSNVEFLGALGDDALVTTMQGCEAAIFPSVDDFGLVPLEVNACGRPVIALRAGGALHTVRPGVSGEFLEAQTADAVVQSVRSFNPRRFDPVSIRAHALRWSKASFRGHLRNAVEDLVPGRAAARRRAHDFRARPRSTRRSIDAGCRRSGRRELPDRRAAVRRLEDRLPAVATPRRDAPGVPVAVI